MTTIKVCLNCKKEFSIYYTVNGEKKHSDKRKFCYECSPIGSHNTKPSLDGSVKRKTKLVTPITEKECKICRKTLSITSYYNGMAACKECHNDRVLQNQRELKKECVDYLGGKCCICGYNRCQGSLEFHHKDPEQKDFGLSQKRRHSFDELKKELDKCILVCANCHREIHANLVDAPII